MTNCIEHAHGRDCPFHGPTPEPSAYETYTAKDGEVSIRRKPAPSAEADAALDPDEHRRLRVMHPNDSTAMGRVLHAYESALSRPAIPPLDVERLVGALAAVDHRIAVEFPEEAAEMESDAAALGRRDYAEAVAREYAALAIPTPEPEG